jgi:hypothetical protein
MDQEARFDSRRGNGRRNDCCSEAAFDGRAYSFVRWKLKRDSKIAKVYAVGFERGLELRARARADLTDYPLGLTKIGGGNVTPFRPRMIGRDDEDESIARDLRSMPSMLLAAKYRRYSRECREMAAQEPDPVERVSIELWAAAWERVADEQEVELKKGLGAVANKTIK